MEEAFSDVGGWGEGGRAWPGCPSGGFRSAELAGLLPFLLLEPPSTTALAPQTPGAREWAALPASTARKGPFPSWRRDPNPALRGLYALAGPPSGRECVWASLCPSYFVPGWLGPAITRQLRVVFQDLFELALWAPPLAREGTPDNPLAFLDLSCPI